MNPVLACLTVVLCFNAMTPSAFYIRLRDKVVYFSSTRTQMGAVDELCGKLGAVRFVMGDDARINDMVLAVIDDISDPTTYWTVRPSPVPQLDDATTDVDPDACERSEKKTGEPFEDESHKCQYIFYFRFVCVKSDACKSEPCLNGGTCDIDPKTSDPLCRCPDEFKGPLCEQLVGKEGTPRKRVARHVTHNPRGPCTTDADYCYNGDCVDHACVCWKWISGTRCDTSNFPIENTVIVFCLNVFYSLRRLQAAFHCFVFFWAAVFLATFCKILVKIVECADKCRKPKTVNIGMV